jgi:hypothetical protein
MKIIYNFSFPKNLCQHQSRVALLGLTGLPSQTRFVFTGKVFGLITLSLYMKNLSIK